MSKMKFPDGLSVDSDSGVIALPGWCKYMVDLGGAVAEHHCQGNRVVVGVVLPTRAYAAAFAALGVVSYRAQYPTLEISGNEHIDIIKKLSKGKPLKLLRNGRRLKGRFDGIQDGYIRVKVEEGRRGWTVILVQLKDSKDVEVDEADEVVLPQSQSGRKFVKNQNFIERLIPGIDISDFAGRSRIECVVLGRVNVLRAEIKNTNLMVQDENRSRGTSMQDVIRVRQFAGESMPFRSIVLPVDGSVAPQPEAIGRNTVFIFDGSLGCRKWRNLFPNYSAVVILDSTEAGFADALASINEEYITGRNVNADIGNTPFILSAPQGGVEVVAYHTRTQ